VKVMLDAGRGLLTLLDDVIALTRDDEAQLEDEDCDPQQTARAVARLLHRGRLILHRGQREDSRAERGSAEAARGEPVAEGAAQAVSRRLRSLQPNVFREGRLLVTHPDGWWRQPAGTLLPGLP